MNRMYPIEKLNNWEHKHFSDIGWVFCNEIKFIYIHIEEYGIIIEKAGKDNIELTLEELQAIYKTSKMIEKEGKKIEKNWKV